jgi:hypothetical protein
MFCSRACLITGYRATLRASRMRLVHSIHLLFASMLAVAESEPKWFIGQYAKTARP